MGTKGIPKREYVLRVRTYPQTAENLRTLTAQLSAQMGTPLTQGQALEILIKRGIVELEEA